MDWYGWTCLLALPFLVWEWIVERREDAILKRIAELPWKGGGGDG